MLSTAGPARKAMRWVRLLHEGSCETCGADTERFVRPMRNGYRATEVTFCPVCSPVVKGVVDIPVTDEEGTGTCTGLLRLPATSGRAESFTGESSMKPG